jgi:NAD(P)-dependent dehydrogenase (short-subunit alcohol dehydrogenase family)
MFDLTGRVVFVAGGAGYLGTPVCLRLLEQGAQVVVADLNEDALSRMRTELSTEQVERVHTVTFDVASEESIDSALKSTSDRFRRLDGLVNATFASSKGWLDDLTAEEFDRTNHVNITGAFMLARRAAADMRAGGSIVMYSSMYGLVSPDPRVYPAGIPPNPVDYGAGKAAIVQMTRYLAAHYAPKGIRVNAVAPGAFPWVSDHAKRDDFLSALANKAMLNRIGERDETAGPVVFLLTDAASFITGQTISVDGGVTAW